MADVLKYGTNPGREGVSQDKCLGSYVNSIILTEFSAFLFITKGFLE